MSVTMCFETPWNSVWTMANFCMIKNIWFSTKNQQSLNNSLKSEEYARSVTLSIGDVRLNFRFCAP